MQESKARCGNLSQDDEKSPKMSLHVMLSCTTESYDSKDWFDSREIFQGLMSHDYKEKVKMNTSDAREKLMTGQRFCYFWTVRLWKYHK